MVFRICRYSNMESKIFFWESEKIKLTEAIFDPITQCNKVENHFSQVRRYRILALNGSYQRSYCPRPTILIFFPLFFQDIFKRNRSDNLDALVLFSLFLISLYGCFLLYADAICYHWILPIFCFRLQLYVGAHRIHQLSITDNNKSLHSIQPLNMPYNYRKNGVERIRRPCTVCHSHRFRARSTLRSLNIFVMRSIYLE